MGSHEGLGPQSQNLSRQALSHWPHRTAAGTVPERGLKSTAPFWAVRRDSTRGAGTSVPESFAPNAIPLASPNGRRDGSGTRTELHAPFSGGATWKCRSEIGANGHRSADSRPRPPVWAARRNPTRGTGTSVPESFAPNTIAPASPNSCRDGSGARTEPGLFML